MSTGSTASAGRILITASLSTVDAIGMVLLPGCRVRLVRKDWPMCVPLAERSRVMLPCSPISIIGQYPGDRAGVPWKWSSRLGSGYTPFPWYSSHRVHPRPGV